MPKKTALDSSFVANLATIVFSMDVLKSSSAGGRRSNSNKVSHIALDVVKLKFVEGNSNINIWRMTKMLPILTLF